VLLLLPVLRGHWQEVKEMGKTNTQTGGRKQQGIRQEDFKGINRKL
jgi:hypothetical protein